MQELVVEYVMFLCVFVCLFCFFVVVKGCVWLYVYVNLFAVTSLLGGPIALAIPYGELLIWFIKKTIIRMQRGKGTNPERWLDYWAIAFLTQPCIFYLSFLCPRCFTLTFKRISSPKSGTSGMLVESKMMWGVFLLEPSSKTQQSFCKKTYKPVQ